MITKKQIKEKIVLDRTCFACPEQYDAYLDGEYVGYLRLRHGTFRVEDEYGNVLGYWNPPKSDGIFVGEERDYYLNKAKKKLAKSIYKKIKNVQSENQ